MYPHDAPTSSVPHMPSPSSFSASLASTPLLFASPRRLSRYLEGDTVALGDERRKCALFIRNVDQRRLDASIVAVHTTIASWHALCSNTLHSDVKRGTHCARWRVDCWGFPARQKPSSVAPITRGEVGPGLPPAGSSVIPTLW
jgi:hypothetical protein